MLHLGRPRRYPTNAARQRAYRERNRRATQHHLQVYHRSLTIEWATPCAFFADLDAEFGFTLDVCATPANAKCARYFTDRDNGLVQPWDGVCWMNPPYGKTIGLWVAKAWLSAQEGATVVCLLPVRTDTKWWQRYCVPPAEIRFIPGRLRFDELREQEGQLVPTPAKETAPFPSAVVVYRPSP